MYSVSDGIHLIDQASNSWERDKDMKKFIVLSPLYQGEWFLITSYLWMCYARSLNDIVQFYYFFSFVSGRK